MKQQIKAESLTNNVRQETVSKSGSESEEDNEDEYKYTEQANMPGTKFDNKKRQTVRNLRIREDTAKVRLISLCYWYKIENWKLKIINTKVCLPSLVLIIDVVNVRRLENLIPTSRKICAPFRSARVIFW